MVEQKEIIEALLKAASSTNPHEYLRALAGRIEAEGIAPPDGYELVPIS